MSGESRVVRAWRIAPRAADLWLAAGFLLAYVALDRLSYLQPIESAGITPWNPPPGLSLALLVTRGLAFAPTVGAAALLGEFLVRGGSAHPQFAIASALWLTAGYSGLAALIRRRLGARPDFRRVAAITWFVGVVSAAVLAVSVGYVALLFGLGPSLALPFPRQVLQFWVGDVIGIFVLTPALLAALAARPRARRPTYEDLAQGVAIGLPLWLLWGIDAALAPRLFYFLFLPLIWVSMRRGVGGAALALVVIQAGLVAGLQITGRHEMVLELQLLMLTLAITGLLLGASVSERALTERALRERQSELDRTLQLAAASETASALAHELNQPLSAIATYLGAGRAMLAQEGVNPERLEDALAAAAAEAARAGQVTRRMREFFQSGAKRLERTEVRELLAAATRSMHAVLERSGVALRLDCDPTAGAAMLDRIQIESVVHQLVQNAVEAMTFAGSARREIVIAARGLGDRISIAVRDSGPGIDPELAGAIPSPFTTTKPHGMGMGLSICRTIIESHGGKLTVETAPSGASISFWVPTGLAEERT